ncbi:MAG: hypothetical protein R3248_10130 [Candidatus Promineifilaceae bacterium]|nr:hypothetical protein [Candidatus Promineifilaceae bacterium]
MKKIRFLLTVFLAAAFGLMIVLPLVAATPTQDLPPRPSTPTPQPPILGAFITLRAWNAPVDAWTAVQWQDGLGDWHDVDGWRGHLDDSEGQEKIWWVAPEDFGTGPFRWLVYGEERDELLAASGGFYLPSRPGEVVIVDVLLP